MLSCYAQEMSVPAVSSTLIPALLATVSDPNHPLRSGSPENSVVLHFGHVLSLAPGKGPTWQKYLGPALLTCQSRSVGSRLPLSPLFSSLLRGFYEKGRLKAKPNLLSWRAKERSQDTRPTSRAGWLGCGNPSRLVVRPTVRQRHLGWDIHGGTRMACSLMGMTVGGSLGFGRIRAT